MLPRGVAVLLLLSACAAEPAPRPTASTVATPPALDAPLTTPATPAPEVYAPRGSATTFPGAPQPVAPSRVAPPSIEAAEAEAAAWVGDLAPSGASDYRCVEASTAVVAMSGGFALDPAEWASGRPDVRLVPADLAEPQRGFNSPLVVRFRSLGHPGTTHLHEALNALDSSSTPPSWLVPLALPPAEGGWLMVASAGRHWGCFVLPSGVPTGAAHARAVTEAERRGAEYPSVPPSDAARLFPLPSTLPRERWTDERRCVDLQGRARSGEWVVSYSFGVEGWSPHLDQSKFGFTPLHQPADLRRIEEPLHLELTYLEDLRQTYDYVVVGSVFGLDEQDRPAGAGFVGSPVPPRAGRWMMVASSGPNWGCFLLDVR